MKKSIALIVLSVMMLSLFATGCTQEPAAPVSVDIEPASVLAEDFEFVHPLTVVTPQELAIIKDRIAKKEEPQYSAYLKLIENAEVVMTKDIDPPAEIAYINLDEKSEEALAQQAMYRTIFSDSSFNIYTLGLAWAHTGDEKYAKKGVEFLNKWVAADTKFGAHDVIFQTNSKFTPILYGYEFLLSYDGYSQDDREGFKNFWYNNVLPNAIRENNSSQNNYKDWAVMAMLTTGIVFEDRELVNMALYELDLYFNGFWKIGNDERGTFLRQEVVRADKSFGDKGVVYNHVSLQGIIQCFDMAHNLGVNYFNRRTVPGRASMQDLVENVFRWGILREPFPWNENPEISTDKESIYETANNYFDIKIISDWLPSVRPIERCYADEYVTLNKGDMKRDIGKIEEAGATAPKEYKAPKGNTQSMELPLLADAVAMQKLGEYVADGKDASNMILSIRDKRTSHIYLTFDTSALSGKISSAELTLTISDEGNTTFYVYKCVSDIDESTLSWVNQPKLESYIVYGKYSDEKTVKEGDKITVSLHPSLFSKNDDGKLTIVLVPVNAERPTTCSSISSRENELGGAVLNVQYVK